MSAFLADVNSAGLVLQANLSEFSLVKIHLQIKNQQPGLLEVVS
ncbi:hypothetical protein Pr1d_41840 [Bythopirellula goksoeyrii]|uniref:Uncharacterized protein n=1 Tax=Bythopirellula goksoeyrii TaxID=1400387 RepID=A0A5B9QCQ5_9BACT|nr:hypothetical protein Pr1d_41840 [Bythopirellula goksoeyrii]